ncbi:MAG: class I SAM-dependent methyltransferase [Prevotellaceae bacterium]|jgi:2-polyprenyl-3-methyl-5-hydroxy-6-metoxy-1,4-benzoquinol methylase|nr:class I SAM-dependent methyltransferase [Prevotellaceae bacterium]
MQNYQCKICANTQGNHAVVVREMMFGFRDEFKYFKCSSCGCLQIAEPPTDLSKYYPSEGYYSYRQVVTSSSYVEKVKNLLKRFLFNLYQRLNMPLQAVPYIRNFGWLKFLKKIAKTSAILDVGCGNGRLLQQMSGWGLKNLTGIDPFIEEDILYPSGMRVWKTDIYDYPPLQHAGNQSLAEHFDLIMLHHSFEHMDNPRAALNQLHKLLSPKGQMLIRVPVSDSFAWRKYGANWFQIDAPRHFFLHTTKSMAILAKECGFVLKQLVHDSTKAQFVHSEKYCRDISLFEDMEIPRTYEKCCTRQAKWLNRIMDGDQACFILEKITN